MKPNIKVYTTTYCPYCDAAKALFEKKQIPYEEIDVSDPVKKMELKSRTGWRTVPQIFIGEEMIGGYQELAALEHSGELGKMLAKLI